MIYQVEDLGHFNCPRRTISADSASRAVQIYAHEFDLNGNLVHSRMVVGGDSYSPWRKWFVHKETTYAAEPR